MAATLRGAHLRRRGRPAAAVKAVPRPQLRPAGRARAEPWTARRSRSSTATRSSSATSGRHRGLADRPDRAVLLRHPLPVAVGADRRRRAALAAVDRRPPVLRGPLLPRAGTGHRLRRLEALGDPQRAVGNGFLEELTILNHDAEPVDLTVSDRGRLRLRRSVRGQGRAPEEGQVLARTSTTTRSSWLRARDVRAGDGDLVVAACEFDETG